MSEARTNPFPGLRPFKFHEHELFFGREEQYEQMIVKLNHARFLAVVGTSGSGKSSLVRAGLLPALYGGLMMSAGSNWRIAVFRPKDDPIRELALALNHHRVFGSRFFENGASLLKVGEVLDWTGFCFRLTKEAAKPQPNVSRRLVELLPSEASQMLRETNSNGGLAPNHQSNLISELNKILKRRDFYQPNAFESALLQAEAQSLLKRGRDSLSDSEIQKFNRLLLEAYYSKEIAKKAEIQTKITEVTLRRGDLGLVEAVRQFKTPPNENLLIVVDQFEELFRYARISENGPHGNQAAAFVKLLLEAKTQTTIPIYVVLTMRSDYLGDCAKFWELPEAINEGEYLIPRLTRDQRREAIRGPIKLRGAEISPQLVNQLLNDMGDNPDELPILQHALMRTWDNWSANHEEGEPIQIRHYQAVGSMAHALSLHADEAYESLPQERRKLTEKLFRCLTEKATGARETRRPASLREIRNVTGATAKEIGAVVNVFRQPDRSFLMPSARKRLKRGTSIDISHESLIRNWTHLKQWVEREANAANTYRRLVETARLFKINRAGLLSALEVEYALKWRELNKPNAAWASRYHVELDDIQKLYANATSDESRRACDKKIFDEAMEFLETSRRAHLRENEERKKQRKSQLRRLQAIAAIFVLATIICLGFFLKAQKEENLANLLTYVENLNSVESELKSNNFGRAHELLNTLMVSNYSGLRGFELDFLARRSVNLLEPELSHDDSVLAVAFVRSQKLLASVSADGKLRLWEPDSWKVANWQKKSWEARELPLTELPNSASTESSTKNPVSIVAFSPNGERFATVDSTHKNLKLWQINESSATQVGRGFHAENNANLWAIVFSADGRFLASANSRYGHGPDETINSIEIWDAATGEKKKGKEEIAEGAVVAMAASSDGTLAIGDSTGNVKWRDLETLEQTPLPVGHPGDKTEKSQEAARGGEPDTGADRTAVQAMAFSPDGKMLVTGRRGNIEVLDTGTLRRLNILEYPSAISYIIFSPNGQTLAVASQNGSVKLWERGKLLDSPIAASDPVREQSTLLTGHSGPIFGVVFLSEPNLLVTASGDKTARLWDPSVRSDSSEAQFSKRIASLAFTADDKTLAVTFSPNDSPDKTHSVAPGEEDVKFLDPGTMNEKDLLGNAKLPYLALSPTREFIATWVDGTLALWDSRGTELATVAGTSKDVKAMAFSKNGERLGIWSLVDGATIYETANKLTTSRRVPTNQHRGQVLSVAFSPDLEVLAVGLENGNVELFSTRTGEPLKPLTGHTAGVLSVAFSSDGQMLATGSADKTVRLWNLRIRKDSAILQGHDMPVQCLAFSEDGKRIATGSWDGTVKLWDANIRNNKDLWDRLKRQELATLRRHANAVLSLAFTHDGFTLASADADNKVYLWKAANQN